MTEAAGTGAMVAVGDLYESDGRSRTVWMVDSIITVPKSGTVVRLAKTDGFGHVTVHLSNLGVGHGFKRVQAAAIPSTGT